MNRSIALPSVGTQLAVPCFHRVVSSSHGARGNCVMFSNGMCHLDRGIPNYLLPVAKGRISRNRQNEMRDACSSLPLVAFLASLMEPGGRIDTFDIFAHIDRTSPGAKICACPGGQTRPKHVRSGIYEMMQTDIPRGNVPHHPNKAGNYPGPYTCAKVV